MALQHEYLHSNVTVAFIGLSRSGKGYGWDILNSIRQYSPITKIIAVHPCATSEEMKGLETVRLADEIKPPPDFAIVVLKPKDAYNAIGELATAGIKKVWLVMGACSKDNREYAEKQGMEVVGGCPILFVEGPGFPHNIHRALAKIFGKI